MLRFRCSASTQWRVITPSGPLCLKKKHIPFLIFLSILLFWSMEWKRWKPESVVAPLIVSTEAKSKNVTILIWHWPFGPAYSLKGDVCWDLYRIRGCKLVDERSQYSKANVIVFHNKELITGKETLPVNLSRPRGQRWAWMSLESPENNGKLQPFANLFNLTLSYRRDADIPIPYGELLPQDKEPPLENLQVKKNNLVCWVVSNYNSRHKRSQVYKELDAIVPVKVYGAWKRLNLTSEDLLPTISQCYFYLAFENSISKDYITEKLWRNAYQAGAVPVVLGPSYKNYKAVAAPNSFIHVDNFRSVKELAAFLQELAKDSKRYKEYFKWTLKWKVKLYTDWRERLCKICPVYNHLPQQKVYSDLDSWVHV